MSKYTKEEIVNILKEYAEDNEYFNEIDLSGVDFSGIGINFDGAKTGYVGFRNATTKNVNFKGAKTGNFFTNFGKCKYKDKVYDYIKLDGIRTYYKDKKEILGFTIYEDFRALTHTKYAITNGIFNAHSETVKGAIKSLRYKIETFNKDKKPIIDKIKDTQQVSKQDYRELTGACEAGVNDFCDRHNITTDTLPLEEVLDLFKDKKDYGIKEFLRYMEE